MLNMLIPISRTKKRKTSGASTQKRLHVAECTLPKSSKFVWPKCNLFFGIRFVHTRVEDHIFLSCGLMNNLQVWLLVEDNSHKSFVGNLRYIMISKRRRGVQGGEVNWKSLESINHKAKKSSGIPWDSTTSFKIPSFCQVGG